MNTQWLLSKWGECMLKSCAWSKMMVFQCACVGKQWQTGSPLREVLFCGRGGMPENPSLLLASNISWEKQLETKSRAEPWIFKGTLGTFQFGLSSLGAQDTKDPTFEVNSIVSFGLCCLTSQSSKSICVTFIILKSFLCLFPPYFFFFCPISDSKLFKRMHCLNSFSSAQHKFFVALHPGNSLKTFNFLFEHSLLSYGTPLPFLESHTLWSLPFKPFKDHYGCHLRCCVQGFLPDPECRKPPASSASEFPKWKTSA